MVPVPSASLFFCFYLPVGGRVPGSVDRGGWPRHRVPGVLPNNADTAHGVQFFDMYSWERRQVTLRMKTQSRTVGTGDIVHA